MARAGIGACWQQASLAGRGLLASGALVAETNERSKKKPAGGGAQRRSAPAAREPSAEVRKTRAKGPISAAPLVMNLSFFLFFSSSFLFFSLGYSLNFYCFVY